jgi:hypothetical protein
MKFRLLLPLAFAVTAVLWSIVTWPLAVRVGDAVPYTPQNIQGDAPRAMVAGDHLQLLYRFWLLDDMLNCNSPFGRNVYEFNSGDDNARRMSGAYYLPFSLVHVGLAHVFGTAFGWNFTGLLSLWLTYVFTILVLRFYTRDDFTAFIFAAVAVLSPYRYWALLSGNPTGFAMLWPPVVVFGLELAFRRGRTAGGVIAGAGLLLCCFSDVQLFLFVFIMAACWGAGLFLRHWLAEKRRFAAAACDGLRLLWPVAAALLLCFVYSRHLMQMIGSSAHMAGGRSMQEVALYSPTVRMLFSPDMSHGTGGMYVGYSWIAIAVFGTAAAIYSAFRCRRAWRGAAVAAVWMAALTCLYLLALGSHGPGEGITLLVARKIISPLRMVRSPSRVVALAPTLIAIMLCVVAAPALAKLRPGKKVLLMCLFAVTMTFEYARCTSIGLTILDTHQGAYASIKADHSGRSASPVRAMALPLWPGDTHWSSLYQYHASLHGVRMLNGYSPVVDRNYYEHVFRSLRSMNAGAIDDSQLDALLRMDIHYVLFYEDAFPEIVSPFPAARTLSCLGANPRLAYLGRDKRVWAFRILEAPGQASAGPIFSIPAGFPARFYDVQASRKNAAALVPDQLAAGGSAVRLSEAHPQIFVSRMGALGGEGIVWLARVRGQGSFRLVMQGEGVDWKSASQPFASDSWQWVAVSTEGMPAYSSGNVAMDWLGGQLDVDFICLTTIREPMGPCYLPAACFFRAGEANDADGSVLFDPARDVKGRIFYGPRLPFKPGRYRVTLEYSSEAPENALLGTWAIEKPITRAVEVRAGTAQAVLDIDQGSNLPVEFAFNFAAAHKVILRSVRVESAPVVDSGAQNSE